MANTPRNRQLQQLSLDLPVAGNSLNLAERPPVERKFGISTELRHMSTSFLQDQLPELSEFMPDQISLATLYKMRRDPMIQLGLHFIRQPLLNATWSIKGPDQTKADFIEWALRRVWRKLLLNILLSLEFGFSAILKRWTYQKPNPSLGLWSAAAAPVVPEDVIALPPDYVEPRFTKAGKFNGIKYLPWGGPPQEIPDQYTFWYTYDREASFGNLYGFPRIGFAYSYWRSYWFRWLLYDRHFEQDADPPLVVWGPSGSYEDEDGGVRHYKDDGVALGNAIRSGATVYMPSQPYVDEQTGKPSQSRQWDMEFKTGGQNIEGFQQTFEYLDVMKLRSLLIPEQALVEGKGGTSSRNVAATYGAIFAESQMVLIRQIDETVNEYFVDKIAAYNFGEEPGTYYKETDDFYRENVDLMGQIITATSLAIDPLEAYIDLRGIAQKLGFPQLTEEEVRQLKQEQEEEAMRKQQQAMEQAAAMAAIKAENTPNNEPPAENNDNAERNE